METEIFDISYEGAGVGRLSGKVCFVPKSLPGEVVDVNVLKETNSFLVGEIQNLMEKSERRIPAKCPYFDRCGGCDLQHVSREDEIEIKKQILQRELAKVFPNQNFDIDFVLGENRFSYRNKIKFEVSGNQIGFFKAKTHDVLAVKSCEIASEKINKCLPNVEQFLQENNFKFLKNVYIKELGENLGICFLFDKNSKKIEKNAKKLQILSDFLIFFAYGDILESDKTEIFGIGKAAGLENEISSFNQVNDEVADKLYAYVLSLAKDKRVVNAYSGQGKLTLMLSGLAKFVYGIEYQQSAHKIAEKNCENIKEWKIENICGRVEDELPKIMLRDQIDLVVLDPAREGCKKEVLSALNSSEIVYISCNFASLARDLRQIKERYSVKNIKVFDMFPCTANMETVVLLKKARSPF